MKSAALTLALLASACGPSPGAGESGGTATTTADSSGPTTTGGSTGTPECWQSELSTSITRRRFIVLDRSEATARLFDHDDDPNTADISVFDASVRFATEFLSPPSSHRHRELGLIVFPSTAAGTPHGSQWCAGPEVLFAPGRHAPEDLIAALQQLDGPAGAGPARAALAEAYAEPADLHDVLLLLHEAPGCAPGPEDLDDELVSVVAAAAGQPIKTAVAAFDLSGSPNSDPNDGIPDGSVAETVLTMIGEAGKAPNGPAILFGPGDGGLVLDSLEPGGGVISCLLLVDAVQPEGAELSVIVEGMGYPQVEDCGTEHGFEWDQPDVLRLCGDACEAFKWGAGVTLREVCPAGSAPPPVLQ